MDIAVWIGLVIVILIVFLVIFTNKSGSKTSALQNELDQLRKAKALDEIEIKKYKAEIKNLMDELDRYKTHINR